MILWVAGMGRWLVVAALAPPAMAALILFSLLGLLPGNPGQSATGTRDRLVLLVMYLVPPG